MTDVKSKELLQYYKKIGREDTAKKIKEDPEYAAKMQKLWDKRKTKKEQREHHEDMEGAGFEAGGVAKKAGGAAQRGLGRAFMKGGRV